jgi:DNA-binding transcriptional MocR family regulator
MGSAKPLINLFRGWPNPSLHPVSSLTVASAAALSNPEISTPALGYGPDDGYPPLRQQIADWLSDFYAPAEPVVKERICITGGASQNLACVLQVFSDALYTRNIWMIAPTYYLACPIFDDAGFASKLRAVPEDEEGLDIAYLHEQIRRSEERAAAEGNLEPVCLSSAATFFLTFFLFFSFLFVASSTSRLLSDTVKL